MELALIMYLCEKHVLARFIFLKNFMVVLITYIKK